MPSAQQTSSNVKSNEILQHPTKDGSLPRSTTTTSTSAVAGSKTPQEYPEFIKQALMTVEKKSRNLEKRRTKLDEYKELQKKGHQLNEDQLTAVNKYEEVKICLELVKDLDKQLVALANDALKAQKKQAKKEQLEREELVKEKLKEVQKLQVVLNTFGDEKIRQDFLDGKFGITPITKEELDLLDEFDKLVSNKQLSKTYENDVNEVTDHYLHLIDGKNKPVLNTTYSELKKLFDKILTSTYWSDDLTKQEQEQEQQEQQETLKDEHEQKVSTANVNTSTDDYVMVSRHEVEITQIENNEDENSLKVQQTTIVQQETQIGPDQILVEQHTDQNTFFTTLNRPDNLIKEFLNENNDGINFLQDSQIYPQQQQQHLHEQHQQHQTQQSDFSSNNIFNSQKSGEYENENANPNSQYGFGKRNDNGFHPRNNGGQNYQRRPFNPDERRGGGRGGSYSGGRGGGRGGFSRGGGSGNNNSGRGGYRGKPRNPGQSFNKNSQVGQQNKSEVNE